MKKIIKFDNRIADRTFFWSLWKVYYPASVCSLIPTDRVLYYHNCSTGGVWCYEFCPVVGEWPHFFNINRKWTFRQWKHGNIFIFIRDPFLPSDISVWFEWRIFKYCIQIFMKGTDDIATTSSVWMVNKITSKKNKKLKKCKMWIL